MGNDLLKAIFRGECMVFFGGGGVRKDGEFRCSIKGGMEYTRPRERKPIHIVEEEKEEEAAATATSQVNKVSRAPSLHFCRKRDSNIQKAVGRNEGLLFLFSCSLYLL